jgi:hypothetical protein
MANHFHGKPSVCFADDLDASDALLGFEDDYHGESVAQSRIGVKNKITLVLLSTLSLGVEVFL